MPHSVHHTKTQPRPKKPPPYISETALMELRRYRLTFTMWKLKPHEFGATGDDDALRRVAEHLSISYPLKLEAFLEARGEAVYCLDTGAKIYPILKH